MTPGAVLAEERFELGDFFGTSVLFDVPRTSGEEQEKEE